MVTTRYATITTGNVRAAPSATTAAAVTSVQASSVPATDEGPSRSVRRLATCVDSRQSRLAQTASTLNQVTAVNPSRCGNLMSSSR